jgi:osmotically-inducible protein OsmY
MAQTPSINPSQASARRTEGGARFDAVLFTALDALEGAHIPFGLIGGVAASGLGRPRSTHDIDVFVRPEDAEATLRVLAQNGFRTEKFDIEWLFKAFKDDVLVDVIFKSEGEMYFDEEVQAHRKLVEYHGRKVPVVSPEDLVIIKCAVHYEGGPHHWHDALAILANATIDWSYLLKRARKASRRVLSLLLYAQSNDILIPNWVISQLYEHLFGEGSKRVTKGVFTAKAEAPITARPSTSRAPEYLVAHIREALAEDGRTAQQDLKVLVSGNRVVVKGECLSEDRRDAIEEVVRAAAPDHELANQVRVAPMRGPERAEEIS